MGRRMILPEERDPRLVTIRRGGTLTDEQHRLLAMWAADCAERVLPLFEAARPRDDRPRRAIAAVRAWTRGEMRMMEARDTAGHANDAARDLAGAPRFAAHAAAQAAAVAHVAAHDLGAAAYAIKAARAAAPEAERLEAGLRERDWQRARLPAEVRALVLDDQRRRDALCWGLFGDDPPPERAPRASARFKRRASVEGEVATRKSAKKPASKGAAKPAKKAAAKPDAPDWRDETIDRMRRLIREAVPDVVEEAKWKKPSNPEGVPTWSHEGIICTGETYKSYVKLTFARGAALKDPARLFNASLEGNARRAIDIHEGEEVDASAFKALVRDAAALNASRR